MVNITSSNFLMGKTPEQQARKAALVKPNPVTPASLKGTMTQPTASAPAPVPPVVPQPTQPAAPIPQPGFGGAPQGSQTGFYDAVSKFVNKSNENQDLVNQKNIMLKSLFDSTPLTPDEMAKLPASVQMDIQHGNEDLLKLNISLINDQLAGRVNNTLNSVKYLLQGYEADQQSATEKRKEAISFVQNAINESGSKAFAGLTPEGRRQLEQSAGLAPGYLDSIPKTLNERSFEHDQYIDGLKNDPNGIVDPFGNIYLEEKDIKAIDASSEGKKLKALGELKRSAKIYKDLVDTHGVELRGTNKSLMESAYADLKVKWKEAANLGALTGPDLELIVDAVKPATGGRGIVAKLSGGIGGIKGSLDQLLTYTDTEATVARDLISSKDPKYGQSSYLKELYTPFEELEEVAPVGSSYQDYLNAIK